MNNEEKIKRWLSDELSEDEMTEFKSSKEYAEINKLLKATENFRSPVYNASEEYKKLSANLFHRKKTINLYNRLTPLMRIAAVIFVAVTIGYFSYKHFYSGTNNPDWITAVPQVYLPDSSVVVLNAGSKIRFDEKNWSNIRHVALEGEAFFKVRKGSQFSVTTPQGKVTVLGTEFDVKDWKGFYEVACYTGSVKVITDNNELILEPNMGYRILNGEDAEYSFYNKSMPEWIEGESSFESVPLLFVLEELERQYNVNIKADDINMNEVFTGSFAHNDLDVALQAITIPLNYTYEIHENKIVISAD